MSPASHSRQPGGVDAAGAIFDRVAAEARSDLDPGEVESLLAGVGIAIDAGRRAPTAAVAVRVTLARTREFGLVLSAGPGGADAVDERYFGRGRGTVHAAAALTGAADFLRLFRRTFSYDKLSSLAPQGAAAVDAQLEAIFAALLALASPAGEAHDAAAGHGQLALNRLELDAVCDGAAFAVVAARCALAAPVARPLPRPIEKIDRLLHPASMGIVGVSASGMNFGRIILRNLVASGYPKERITVIRAGESEIDGVRCVPGLRALERKLDLLIVAVNAEAVYALVDEIIETDAAESVMLIPGGLGETAKSREPAVAMAARIRAAHGRPGGGPVFLGGNCLGVVSHPGGYDSWFIPLERLPKPNKKPERTAVLVSQSGAFMITRLSHNPWLDPRYMLAIGNQADLTHGDLLTWFAQQPEIETIGVYVEGFRDLDGLAFARAVRRAVRNGKDVVVYKAGRTAPGARAAVGHTASEAGDYALFESVVRHAGAMVADDVNRFDDLLHIAAALHRKRIGGNRLGAISGAGFEAVSMADSIECDGFALQLGALAPATVGRIEQILAAKRLDALVEVGNPIDINPGADDEAHLAIAEAFLDDPNIDAVVVALDPTAPAVRALERSSLRPGYDLDDPASTAARMPPLAARFDKPLIGVIDAGRLYDAFAARLLDQGVCVFRNCARATAALVQYVQARLYAQELATTPEDPR